MKHNQLGVSGVEVADFRHQPLATPLPPSLGGEGFVNYIHIYT